MKAFGLLSALFLLIGCADNSNNGDGELRQKYVWTDLQGMEFNYRENHNLHVPILLKNQIGPGKYDVVAIASKGGATSSRPYVWIVVNAHPGVGPNKIYIEPYDVDFFLPCKFLDDLKKNEKLDPVVNKFLESHCANQSEEPGRLG